MGYIPRNSPPLRLRCRCCAPSLPLLLLRLNCCCCSFCSVSAIVARCVGAAALVLVTGEKALELVLQVIAKIRGFADAAQLTEMEFVNPEGLRLDGRRPTEMRQLRAEIGTVAKADGSAVFEMGNTKVIAAVYGPREVQNKSQQMSDQALVLCEHSMANFSTGDRMRKPKGDRRSMEISLVIRQTMEACIWTYLMPRSQIDIFVQVLQADGGTRSACINAAT